MGAKVQPTEPEGTSNPFEPKCIKRLQEIIGSLLFNGQGVDVTLMLTLNELASAQAQGTEATKLALLKVLDYCDTHDDEKIRYFASEMILHMNSDASYLSAYRARSRVGGNFFLSNKISEGQQIRNNGAILVIVAILKNVMASAAESELGGLFLNGKEQ